MKLKELHRIEMPRERLAKYGAGKLADYELLAILLGSGVQGVNVLALAKQILKKVRAVGAANITLEELQKIRGLGTAKASQVVALLALAGRLNTNEPASVFQTKDIYHQCADFRTSKKEHFAAFYLDTQNNLIERQIISIGTLNSSLVHPREVFEPAIRHSAANIIVAHNHPGGALDPSPEDIDVTHRLKNAGEILGIHLIDHVIVTDTKYQSIMKFI
ncbi:hypothetical protein A3C87_00415 [Candidatus Kaiserbacteria bacterium RIFCSPHIGHO2_02_FULL_49_34]|uniref:MPN domain-containing protein n=1 Tax=Candidatus Kaiserbacteria bacterium RIFCSPHIGHO2_02_FULL_49_34 TaxID=1798491 RepID=A0A1F6DKJ8_9BACT|nr:MAG: hypothetical protein A3C87_00415 [Candidatus Kaiserbacteria bacterium RIFCSPHIGHO2_02_FULL_49_34]